jgi:hypothetical protein
MQFGCGGSDAEAEACAILPATCSPSFDTDFATVHKNVFQLRCGTANGVTSCHGSDGNQGGLTLSDPAKAYDALISSGLVIPGDAQCSPLMVRLETDDAAKRMPRGEAKLPAGIRCAVQRWISEGASR